jgi:hypothetical protein
MKKLEILLVAILITIGFSACKNNSTKQTKIAKVDTLEMSEDTVDLHIQKIMNQYVEFIQQQQQKDSNVLFTIVETNNILKDLATGKTNSAKTELQTLIGKLEVYLTQNPNSAMVPVGVAYHKVETVNNIDTVRKMTDLAKKAMQKGYYQTAGDILSNLKSEMVISTTYLPIAAYTDGLKASAALLDQNKNSEAMAIMQSALSSVVITNIKIPLPILKAEVMIDEAASIDAKDHKHSEQVANLLDNAKYQIKLAEEMGYGKKDAEFESLYKAIQDIKNSVKTKNDSHKKFKALEKEIKNFKKRLFPVKK